MNGAPGWLKSLHHDKRGSIAVKFALVVPVIATLSAGAIDLMAVSSSRSRLQSIAENAALAGARSLTLAADSVTAEQAAENFVKGEMSEWSTAPTYTAAYSVTETKDGRRLQVRLTGHRPSFFGSLLPPGGWHFSADATASPVSQTPLCAIGTGSGTNLNALSSIGASRLTAPECMVHSNSNILTGNTATITALAVQAVRGVTGTGISPAAGEGAVPIEDPFASMVFPSLNDCKTQNKNSGQEWPIVYPQNTTYYLDPGLHCRPITIRNSTTLILRPGVHLFYKNLSVLNSARLIGEDVFLFFDEGAGPVFTGSSIQIDLSGRKSGPYAGMVMATIAGDEPDIIIPGRQVKRLLGVVYARNGFLRVGGIGIAAQDSDWTVVVANEIRLEQDASLRINADYENSDVPVPAGVGPNGGIRASTRLLN
ncbi:pilus assembly protein [Brevundimonas sp. AJA228-03]|uniref:TadE/TadG family type IV pilus assembly protein n=1 Tax=Brevundimonas sp. AJA228-03 TaxID=2752515 RepID=UPI001ADF3A6E|nr:TadE/TadG family type IV pilus assembly protein [Brevundimonas sp. AJA228-03]QTN18332.1 pilus assembly protein [Brevundimonas sp. AJA228-03]